MTHRRDALRALAAIAMAQLGGCVLAPTRAKGDVDRPVVDPRVRAFALLRGALDDRILIGNVVGSCNGVVGTAIEPLFGLDGHLMAHGSGAYGIATAALPALSSQRCGAGDLGP